jgi:hypothetical protein
MLMLTEYNRFFVNLVEDSFLVTVLEHKYSILTKKTRANFDFFPHQLFMMKQKELSLSLDRPNRRLIQHSNQLLSWTKLSTKS